MIYITGDTHGDIDWSKLNTTNFPEQKLLDKDDCPKFNSASERERKTQQCVLG